MKAARSLRNATAALALGALTAPVVGGATAVASTSLATPFAVTMSEMAQANTHRFALSLKVPSIKCATGTTAPVIVTAMLNGQTLTATGKASGTYVASGAFVLARCVSPTAGAPLVARYHAGLFVSTAWNFAKGWTSIAQLIPASEPAADLLSVKPGDVLAVRGSTTYGKVSSQVYSVADTATGKSVKRTGAGIDGNSIFLMTQGGWFGSTTRWPSFSPVHFTGWAIDGKAPYDDFEYAQKNAAGKTVIAATASPTGAPTTVTEYQPVA